MDSFIKRTRPSEPAPSPGNKALNKIKTRKEQTDFLSVHTKQFVDSNKDVGVDILGVLKDNLENVVNYFDLVKELENVKGELQQFQFTQPYPGKDYKLIEMDKALLEAFDNGESMTFRGGADDNVVLCTGDRTYDVKETETTNTLLLTPKMACAETVVDFPDRKLVVMKVPMLRRHYLELREMGVVSLVRLREVLHEAELDNCADDKIEESKKRTFGDLLEIIQISEGELKAVLKTMPVFEYMGHLRWLSLGLRNSLLDAVVDVIDDGCLEKDESISFETLRKRIPDTEKFPDALLWWLLESHFTPVDENGSETLIETLDPLTEPSWSAMSPFLANPRSFARTRALPVLLTTKKMTTRQLKEVVNRKLPMGMECKLEYLSGISLITQSVTQGECIEYFSGTDLPEAPRERLAVLFGARPRWRAEEASPYLEDILPRGIAPVAFMHTHCRSETGPAGERIFCALKPL